TTNERRSKPPLRKSKPHWPAEPRIPSSSRCENSTPPRKRSPLAWWKKRWKKRSSESWEADARSHFPTARGASSLPLVSEKTMAWFHCGRCGSLFRARKGDRGDRECTECGRDPSLIGLPTQ